MTTKTGDKYTGIFAGFSTDNNESAYLMKMVQNAASTTENGENGYVGVGTDYAMSFYIKDVVDLAAENITLEDTAVKPQNGECLLLRRFFGRSNVSRYTIRIQD